MENNLVDITSNRDPVMDIADPTTGLTKRERLIVQKTWSDACQIGKANVGIALFDLYFTRNPEYVKLFKALRDIPTNQLKSHPRLKAHGTTVVQAISGVIENLEDAETTVLLLQKTGRDHVKRNIKPENFIELQKTILILLESALGPQVWTPLVKSSWNKALTVVMDVVMQSMKQEEIDRST